MTADLIREAARQGGFRLNVWKVENGHQANFSRDGKSWRVVIDEDPARAVEIALTEPQSGADPAPKQAVAEVGGIFD